MVRPLIRYVQSKGAIAGRRLAFPQAGPGSSSCVQATALEKDLRRSRYGLFSKTSCRVAIMIQL
jgi:hypothetical protein